MLQLYFSAFGIGSDSWPPCSTLAGLCPSRRNPLSWAGATVKSPSVLQMALLRVPSPPQTSTITLLHKQAYICKTAARPGPPTVALLLCPDAFYIICASGPVLFSFLFFKNATAECQAEVCLWAPRWPESHSDHFYTCPVWAAAKYDFAARNAAFWGATCIQQTFTPWYTLAPGPSCCMQTHVLPICQPSPSGMLFSSNYVGISNKSVQLSSVRVTFFRH